MGRLSNERITPSSSDVSGAFKAFLSEAPAHSKAWMNAAQDLEAVSALEKKTAHLAYPAVLAALRLENGIPFHVRLAKQAGASRAEVISALPYPEQYLNLFVTEHRLPSPGST